MRILKRIIGSLMGLALSVATAYPQTSNTLAIFRPASLPPDARSNGSVPADRIPLVGPPLLADKDFLSYNLTNHTFTVSAATAKRLAVSLDPENPYKMANGEFVFAIGDPPRPFVVCAFGKPIYAGNFTSMTWPKATIWCTDNYFTSNHVANVGFVINPSPFSQVSPFLPPAANGPDRRADKEIVRALKKLKLTK